ncbi:transposase [Streptomyces halobius]|uniref:transposase n=1 Tax=Streptomyces halobius TaxID=2879846 RepID=UPI0038735B41
MAERLPDRNMQALQQLGRLFPLHHVQPVGSGACGTGARGRCRKTQNVIEPSALVIDDTGFLKDGEASACVSRQYTSNSGKFTKCQAGSPSSPGLRPRLGHCELASVPPQDLEPASPRADTDRRGRSSPRRVRARPAIAEEEDADRPDARRGRRWTHEPGSGRWPTCAAAAATSSPTARSPVPAA